MKDPVVKKMWHPPYATKPEPSAYLNYGDYSFEISATLMYYIQGWLSIGMSGSRVPAKAMQDVSSAFDYIVKNMLSSAYPLSDAEKEFYSRHGLIREEETQLLWDDNPEPEYYPDGIPQDIAQAILEHVEAESRGTVQWQSQEVAAIARLLDRDQIVVEDIDIRGADCVPEL